MQRSVSIPLSTLLLSATFWVSVAQAQTTKAMPTSLNPYVVNPSSVSSVSPFNLAYLAYRGYLKDEGIPGDSALINEIVSGTVTAQEVIQAAVKANRLPEETLNDRSYRSALENQLQDFTTD
jgi:hypothetical protein